MAQTIYATKVGMTSLFTASGEWVGATVLKYHPMKVESLRTKDKHGYTAVRYAVTDDRRKVAKQLLRELRTEETPEPGTELKIEEVLHEGDTVQVSGISKGKGTAGVVKRHNFRGGPRTHGQSDRERAPGSSGSGTTPGRVFKGKRRAGHMGVDTITMRGVKVLSINPETRQLVLMGSIPGNKLSLISITKK